MPPAPAAPPTVGPPNAAPYYPPPPYPPPATRTTLPTDGRAIISLAASILGVLLGLAFGLPGLALGPLGYFMGRSAVARIEGEPGTAGGRGLAVTGWVLGIVATAIGAVVSLAWLVLILMSLAADQTLG
jgi:hypothetical protein